MTSASFWIILEFWVILMVLTHCQFQITESQLYMRIKHKFCPWTARNSLIIVRHTDPKAANAAPPHYIASVLQLRWDLGVGIEHFRPLSTVPGVMLNNQPVFSWMPEASELLLDPFPVFWALSVPLRSYINHCSSALHWTE